MRISDWSSDVCSSDLDARRHTGRYGFRQFHGTLRRSRMDMLGSLAFYIPVFVLVLLFLTAAIKILREYERGVVFTLARFTAVKALGLILLVPSCHQMVRLELSQVGLDEPTPNDITAEQV